MPFRDTATKAVPCLWHLPIRLRSIQVEKSYEIVHQLVDGKHPIR